MSFIFGLSFSQPSLRRRASSSSLRTLCRKTYHDCFLINNQFPVYTLLPHQTLLLVSFHHFSINKNSLPEHRKLRLVVKSYPSRQPFLDNLKKFHHNKTACTPEATRCGYVSHCKCTPTTCFTAKGCVIRRPSFRAFLSTLVQDITVSRMRTSISKLVWSK